MQKDMRKQIGFFFSKTTLGFHDNVCRMKSCLLNFCLSFLRLFSKCKLQKTKMLEKTNFFMELLILAL
jgi:hypothetical protein